MTEFKDKLGEHRQKIDQIDADILTLINNRAKCALEVAEVKQQESGDVAPVYYRPEREAQVLRTIASLNKGPLSNEKVTHYAFC